MSVILAPLVAAPSYDEAARFLAALDPTADVFHFRTFGDVAKGSGRNYTGSIAEHFGTLAERNAAGDGVFYVVNDGGKDAASITRVRALFVDLDGSPIDPVIACTLPPNIVLQTSPDRGHAYWLCDGLSLDEFKPLQRAIAARFGGDSVVCDLPRVMRLPGYYHRKGDPFPVQIRGAINATRYTAEQLRAEFGASNVLQLPERVTSSTVGAGAAVLPAPFTPGAVAGQLDADAVRAALRFLDAGDPATWRQVTCALRGYDEAGWNLWEEWSKTAPAAYDTGGNLKVWAKCSPLDGGQRVIFATAQAKGWANTVFAPLPHSWTMPPGPRPMLRFHRFGNIESVPTCYLVEGWIPSASLAAIIGSSSSGKTFAALSIACAIATGTPWFGNDVEQGAVFYLAGEGQSGLKKRGEAWAIEHEVNLDEAPLWFADYLPPLTEPANVQAIVVAIQSLLGERGTPKLIVIDTLNRAFNGEDENSASAMSLFISACDRMKAELAGATVLVIHHTGHDTSRARGSSAFFAALDSCAMVKRDDNGRVQLNNTKQKDSDTAVPMLLELVRVELVNGDSSAVLRTPAVDQLKEFTVAKYVDAKTTDGSYQYNSREAEIMLKRLGIDVSKATINRRRKSKT